MKEYGILELQQGLEEGKWTSYELVQMYIEQIKNIDQQGPMLNSIAEINPEALEIAKVLDEERKTSGPRGLLHGIPIILKDNINTDDKMHTSASSLALANHYADDDAFIVKKLRKAGAIILGKANLSEFAYFMSFDDMPSGYGSRFGQVKSPYSENIDPLGSSTGSAVAVAANLTTIAIGTETNGSLMAPAQQSSIVAIKPTLGLVSRTGIIPISHYQDTAGPMARTVEDAAILMEYLVGEDNKDLYTKLIPNKSFNFSQTYDTGSKHMRVGFLLFDNVKYEKEEVMIMEKAKELLADVGYDITVLKAKEPEMPNHESLIYEFKVDLNAYLAKASKSCEVRSLKELIVFNRLDPSRRLKYGQSIFEASEATSGTLKEPKYIETRKKLLEDAELLNKLMDKHNLDVIVMPRRTSHAPIAGNPIITVPAKSLVDDKPRSLFFVARNFEDEKCIQVAYQYEQKTKFRIKPFIAFLS